MYESDKTLENHAPVKNTNILTVKALYLEPLINSHLS